MPGDEIAGRFELVELVGAGGMSSVFRARDRDLERDVALKILHDRLVAEQDIVERFSREAKLVAGLSHRNIVAVIDRGQHEGKPYIVFEYIPGENVKQLVVREGPLPVGRALELAIEIARGLAFAHEQGFVHRDVKPQNVLLNGKGEAKVTDFGIARPLAVQDGETQTGTVLGTCDYISPEQAQGRRVDAQSDIYSLGVVLYELLTANVPFTGDNFVAVALQHINTPPPHVSESRPDVPPRVDAAVSRALAKDPAARFETMAAFCSELEDCLSELRAATPDLDVTNILPARPGKKPAPAPAPASAAKRRRRRWPIAVAVLVVVVGAVAAIAVWSDSDSGGNSGGGGGGGLLVPVHLEAVAAYDPDGNPPGQENNSAVPYATDGVMSTAWDTEHYRYGNGEMNKPGVGIILEAPTSVKARELIVYSSTPGYRALIQSSDSQSGPFTPDSDSVVGTSKTVFDLHGATSRYYLIWITNLGPANQVDISEVDGRT